MPRMKLLPRIMHICGTLDCDGYISPRLVGLHMEEANKNPIEPDVSVPMFHAETMHCETKETHFVVMILPHDVNPSNLVDWMSEEVVHKMNLIPSRFEVRVGDAVVLEGMGTLSGGDE